METLSGSPLRDSTILALARMEHAPPEAASWSDADASLLRGAASHLLHLQVDAAAFLSPHAGRLVQGIDLMPFLADNGPFGPSWPAHPLASPAMNAPYKLREPDVTRSLARFMGPSCGRRGAERAISFLKVVADLADRPLIADALDDRTRPVVSAEHPVTAAGQRTMGAPGPAREGFRTRSAPRIDLMFEWPVGMGGRQAVVIIEAKLGATVGDGQLKPYSEEGKRRARGGPLALVLLTAHADKAAPRHRSWAAVRWFALMRRWEHALAAAGDDDPEFARVRAHIWRFILSSGGVFP